MRYDKFESLSLPLPSGAGDLGWGRHKLHQLLTDFVTPEVIQDVECEGCNKNREPGEPPILSRQIKILNFGKVLFSSLFFIYCKGTCDVPVACMFVHTYFKKHLVSKWHVKTTRLYPISYATVNDGIYICSSTLSKKNSWGKLGT